MESCRTEDILKDIIIRKDENDKDIGLDGRNASVIRYSKVLLHQMITWRINASECCLRITFMSKSVEENYECDKSNRHFLPG